MRRARRLAKWGRSALSQTFTSLCLACLPSAQLTSGVAGPTCTADNRLQPLEHGLMPLQAGMWIDHIVMIGSIPKDRLESKDVKSRRPAVPFCF
ncbi:hypothetical protein OsI_01243 [Oryza sativa Indica Group]|uniref:Secreted protein n=1 Tax=Oryza sativa subsp. indica TaxID=39946 RepID=A2WN19_ORYSI|nr:hypothetical protein OsI_01243 [Oryza sativa Indica Group]